MRILFLAAVAAALLSAADISGTWKTSYTTENGLVREADLVLKVDGERLTGTLTSERGSARIEQGEVRGSSISFILVRKGNGDEIQVEYRGTVEGSDMKLTMRYGRRPPVPVAAKRIS